MTPCHHFQVKRIKILQRNIYRAGRTPLFSNRQALKERRQSGNHRRPYQQLFRFKEVQRKTGLSDL